MRWAMLRIEGVFFIDFEPEDDDDYGDDYDGTISGADHDRIVEKFIAENPGLNRAELEIVEVSLDDENED